MRILIGITAGISAYKIPLLIRKFIKEGCEVRCIMTPDSKEGRSSLWNRKNLIAIREFEQELTKISLWSAVCAADTVTQADQATTS